MRKLIVIANDAYVRNLVESGAFEALEGNETFYVAGPVHNPAPLETRGNFLGTVDVSPERRDSYSTIRRLLLTHYRFRSRTQKIKIGQMSWRRRVKFKLPALPGIRQFLIRRHLATTGVHTQLLDIARELRPDIVIAPSGGNDPLAVDAVRVARELGVPSMLVIYNWDNLSSKAAFAVEPDYLAVVGRQSVDHAELIHRIPAERVRAIGGPYIDHYFRHQPGSTKAPFPFRYALFAGCYLPFDELSALAILEDTIERQRLDLKIVYRPHPHRRRRARPDRVDEERFKHVVIDPQVRDAYLASFEHYGRAGPAPKPLMPALDYYPALLEHAEFVICPLSTMMIEAAVFEKRVLVIAYNDGLHPYSPGVAVKYLHFEGIDGVDGFRVCREESQLGPALAALAGGEGHPERPMREQVRYWLEFDERSYTERLADWVVEAGARSSVQSPAAGELAPSRVPIS